MKRNKLRFQRVWVGKAMFSWSIPYTFFLNQTKPKCNVINWNIYSNYFLFLFLLFLSGLWDDKHEITEGKINEENFKLQTIYFLLFFSLFYFCKPISIQVNVPWDRHLIKLIISRRLYFVCVCMLPDWTNKMNLEIVSVFDHNDYRKIKQSEKGKEEKKTNKRERERENLELSNVRYDSWVLKVNLLYISLLVSLFEGNNLNPK